jgi:hypothetical protein
MYPNNNCNTCDDCPPICIIFTVGGERLQPYSCSVEQSGIYNDKPYYQLYEPGCTTLTDLFVWWNIVTNRWELTEALGSGSVISFNMNPGLHPISNSGFNWIDNVIYYFIVSSLEGPCPGPLPLPDLSELCGDEYPAACVIYTGPDIQCLGIESGMTFIEVLAIFNNILPGCDCCEKNPVDCVVGPWGPWGQCECYYEDELLVCGRESRTRIVTTPPQDGGAACPPLVEYRPCDLPDVCFTFGSDLCDNAPDATQILASPAGLLNGRPYYKLEFTCAANDLYVWFSNVTEVWNITPVLGTPVSGLQTLNNNSNYLPISNQTTQKWSNCESCGNPLISSQLGTCTDAKMCFQYTILSPSLGQVFTYYTYVAPTGLSDLSFPNYSWSITTPDGVFNIIVEHNNGGGWQFYYQTGIFDIVPAGTLDTNTFNPISTSTIQWIGEEFHQVYMLSSTLGGPCVQPPDVNCVLNCGPWSECIGGTRTRTCTVVTPPSGNGTPCPPLLQTEVCAVPNCFPPTAVVATDTSSNIVISFTGVSGAASYQVSYSIDGGTPVLLSGVTSPITLPYTCDATYTGTIVTQCSNGLTSSPVSWGPITTDPCGPCGTEPARAMIGGTSISSPVGGTIALNGSDTQYGGNLNFGSTGYSIREIVLIPAGYIYAGQLNFVSSTSFPAISGFYGAVLIGCDFQPVPSFFGSGFTSATGAQGVVYRVVYDAATNRIYVGGTFAKYKGVNCTPNFVVLNATTGNIDTTFATNAVGAARTTGYVAVQGIAVQSTGRIVVGGAFDSMYGNTVNAKYICRFLPTGVIDTSFTPGASITNTTPQNNLNVLIVDSADNIFIGGSFGAYQGTARSCFAKLLPNGALDTIFNPGVILFSGGCIVPYVSCIALQGSNVLLGGTISTYNGTPVPSFARVNGTTAVLDGTLNLYSPVVPSGCARVERIVVKNNRIHLGTTWSSYNISNKALYYVLDANGTPAFNTTVVITPGGSGSTINSILLLP